MSYPEDIYTLFRRVREHPDFVGGTIFTTEDIPEGKKLPDGWREKWLTDRLAETGNRVLDVECVPLEPLELLGQEGESDDDV